MLDEAAACGGSAGDAAAIGGQLWSGPTGPALGAVAH